MEISDPKKKITIVIFFLITLAAFLFYSGYALAFSDSERGITNVRINSITQTSATISYDTAAPQITHVMCDEADSFAGCGRWFPTGEPSRSHRVTLTGLKAGTNYNFFIYQQYESADHGWEEHHFRTNVRFVSFDPLPIIRINPDAIDIEKPDISRVAISGVTRTGAVISWRTNEGATSRVEYGQEFGRMTLGGQNDNVTSHRVSLSSLKSGKIHYFRVRSKDAAGNEAYGQWMTFRTYSTVSLDDGTGADEEEPAPGEDLPDDPTDSIDSTSSDVTASDTINTVSDGSITEEGSVGIIPIEGLKEVISGSLIGGSEPYLNEYIGNNQNVADMTASRKDNEGNMSGFFSKLAYGVTSDYFLSILSGLLKFMIYFVCLASIIVIVIYYIKKKKK